MKNLQNNTQLFLGLDDNSNEDIGFSVSATSGGYVKKIIGFVCVLAVCSACAAFDEGNTPPLFGYESDGTPSAALTKGAFDGFYSGVVTEVKNYCENDAAKISENSFSINVEQVDNVIVGTFADKKNAEGNLDVGTASVIYSVVLLVPRDGVDWYYDLYFRFDGEKLGGKIYVSESEGKKFCASARFDLTKGEKPADFGMTNDGAALPTE